MNPRAWSAVVVLALSSVAIGSGVPAAPTGLQRRVVYTSYPPFADNAQLLRRLFSPLHALRTENAVSDLSAWLRAWPLAPAKQHFALYVPPGPPPADGYGLLVFVPPWQDARVPLSWIPVLNRYHMIFISAARSGNKAGVVERRDPLALLAEYNVVKQYRVDPKRVYVGGFSGGSRVALRIALGYPDVFHGALLDAGSDPIGTAQVPLPPVALLHRFQQSTRIVFLTGERDNIRQVMAARARVALQHWCVFDHDSITIPLLGHALAGAGDFARALDALARRKPPQPTKLVACRKRNTRALDAGLTKVQASIDHGKQGKARKVLRTIDAQFGGLAAPRSVALMRKLDSRP